MYQAIVLAAGYSSRAKTNKFAMTIEGIPILTRIVMTLLQVCNEVIVVTGHYKEDAERLVTEFPQVQTVHNDHYPDGMFGSVLTGVAKVNGDCLIVPADCPVFTSETCKMLLASEGDIAVPVYQGHKGHPLLVRQTLMASLRQEPIDSNLKKFRNRHELTLVKVNDPGILADIDTVADYDGLLDRMTLDK